MITSCALQFLQPRCINPDIGRHWISEIKISELILPRVPVTFQYKIRALNTALGKGIPCEGTHLSQAHTEVPTTTYPQRPTRTEMLCKATDIIGKLRRFYSTPILLRSLNRICDVVFSSYDDGVARQTEDSGGNLVTNGVAYGLAHRVTELINNFISGATPDPDDTEAGTIPFDQCLTGC